MSVPQMLTGTENSCRCTRIFHVTRGQRYYNRYHMTGKYNGLKTLISRG